MATLLQTVNRVLRRLREDQVTDTDLNEYTELITEFVIEGYEEVLDAHMWEAFKHEIKVNVADGTSKYDISRIESNSGNVDDSYTPCTIDSELQWTDQNVPMVAVYDSDSDYQDNGGLRYVDPDLFRQVKRMDTSETNTELTYFTIYPESNGTVTRLYLEFYPEPDAARKFYATFWTPPADLTNDGASDAQDLLIPERPVRLWALMMALNERGEEIGEPGNLAEQNYYRALGAAIDRDMNAAQRANKYDWRRD